MRRKVIVRRSKLEIENERIHLIWKKSLKAERRYKSQLKIKAPPISLVLSCVASYYRISYDRLRNCRYNKIITRYRWMLFYICKRVLGYSFRKITTVLGLVEGTVYRGLERFKELMLIDPSMALDIRAIRMKLNRKYAR